MAIILDTDVLIRGEKESFDVERWLADRAGEMVEIAAISVAELWHGVERADTAHRFRREQYVRAALDALLVVPYTEAIAMQHARLWAALESSGKMIGAHDLIIAATALERGSTVATFNRRHFSQIKGLSVIQPR